MSTIKISASFPKAVEFLNGLIPYAGEINEAELNADDGDYWTGVAVVELQAVQAGRISITGEPAPEVRISRIELMRDGREVVARKLLDDAYENRTRAGGLLDPELLDDSVEPTSVKPMPQNRDVHQNTLRTAAARAARVWANGDRPEHDDTGDAS